MMKSPLSSFRSYGLLGLLFASACVGRASNLRGVGTDCSTETKCVAGSVCLEGRCVRICNSASDCRAGEGCLEGVCSSAQPPSITKVDGTGTYDASADRSAVADELEILGTGLAGSEVTLDGVALTLCEVGDERLRAKLPVTLVPGEYTLTVVNEAGSCSTTVQLLRGEAGAQGERGETGPAGTFDTTAADAAYVNAAGDTVTGAITFAVDPVFNAGAIPLESVGFTYAASATKGGDASGLSCSACVTDAEITDVDWTKLDNVPSELADGTDDAGGVAGGDLSGSYPNPTVDGLQGRAVSATTPTSGQALVYTGGAWTPTTLATGGISNFEVFDASGSFTVPAGVTRVLVEVWGGGGGGAGGITDCVAGDNHATTMGAGGGGGGYVKGFVTVTPGAMVTVAVGTGGTAGNTSSSGGGGGTSSFGTALNATGGGGGGSVGCQSFGSASPGGTGSGSGAFIAAAGAASTPVGPALTGRDWDDIGNYVHGFGGHGGAAGGGGGAGGPASNSTVFVNYGAPGQAPGGGGGGGTGTGGAGAAGRIIVWY